MSLLGNEIKCGDNLLGLLGLAPHGNTELRLLYNFYASKKTILLKNRHSDLPVLRPGCNAAATSSPSE